MKPLKQIKPSVLLFALIMGFIISSCTKEESIVAPETNSSESLQLKNATIPPEDVFCNLVAGQTINAGQVVLSHDAVNLYVTYLASNGWTLSEVHLYVGTADGVPRNKTAIQIGQFPYSATNLNEIAQYTFTIPLLGLQKDEHGYAIFAHAVVKNSSGQETAWSNCTYKPLITLKTHFTDGTFAVTDGVHFSSDWYCTSLGTNVYEKDDEYMLQSGTYPASSGGAGRVNVTDDGIYLYVTVTPKDGLVIDASYLFVGDWAFLQSIYKPGGGTCPAYYDFPYQNFDNTPFKILMPPVKNSISFESQFGSNRWGWFNYYNF